MTWAYYFLMGVVLAGVDVGVLNSFDGIFLALSFIAALLLIRSLKRNKNGILFLTPILTINYLYGHTKIFYFYVVIYFAILFMVKDEWIKTTISEFRLCSALLMFPYLLLIIIRHNFWPNIIASFFLSLLVYALIFLILKHDKKRILSKQGF